MKVKILLLLTTPFLVMILVNEGVRTTIAEKPYEIFGLSTINSAIPIKEKCSWVCHNRTNYCKEHHVKFLKPYFELLDPIYFGIINRLKSTGNYGLANVFFLVLV